MEKKKKKVQSIQFKLHMIEMLGKSLKTPNKELLPITKFNFDIRLENRVSKEEKLLFIIVSTDIIDNDETTIHGSLSISCIYNVENFDELIDLNSKGININKQLLELTTSVSLSTLRGVMFSEFKGTVLHAAILPVMDMRQVLNNPIIERKE